MADQEQQKEFKTSEAQRAAAKRYRERHRDAINAQRREYRHANADKYNTYMREFHRAKAKQAKLLKDLDAAIQATKAIGEHPSCEGGSPMQKLETPSK